MKPHIWKALLEQSAQMTVPARVSGALSPTDIEEYMVLYGDILRGFITRQESHAGLKLYIEHQLVPGADPVMQNPPVATETVETWAARLFPEKRFGMILNNLEKYSNRFTEKSEPRHAVPFGSHRYAVGGIGLFVFYGKLWVHPFWNP